MVKTDYITEEWRRQGVSLHEVGDHVLELRHQGQLIARFSQTGARVENIVRIIKANLRAREN